MDFRLTDEQIQIKQTVKDFAESEIKPHVMKWDEAQTFPIDVVKKLGDLGMLGAIFPEEYGGAGLSYVDYVNIIEELGVVDSGVGLTVAAHNSLCTGHIYQAGNDEQKKKWLPKLTSGEWIGAWGLTEPGSGSVPASNVLGKVGYGFVDALKVLDGGRISIGALAVGIARGAYEAARDYSKQRNAFGHPIADFQAIQFMLADMAMETDAARLLCYRAATMKDAGERITHFSAMAKLHASAVAVRCTEKGVQIFGAYGSIMDFPAEKY